MTLLPRCKFLLRFTNFQARMMCSPSRRLCVKQGYVNLNMACFRPSSESVYFLLSFHHHHLPCEGLIACREAVEVDARRQSFCIPGDLVITLGY
jgi:hypothetical protein